MSTMVPMPVRVKPPPADTGEIISPGCASFEITTPPNGARTTMSVRFVCCRLHLALGDADLLRRCSAIRAFSEAHVRLRLVELGLADHAFLEELLPPAQRELRLLEARLVFRRRLVRRGQLRLGQGQRRARLGVVEVRQGVPFPDRVAFLDQDAPGPCQSRQLCIIIYSLDSCCSSAIAVLASVMATSSNTAAQPARRGPVVAGRRVLSGNRTRRDFFSTLSCLGLGRRAEQSSPARSALSCHPPEDRVRLTNQRGSQHCCFQACCCDPRCW